MTNQYWAYWNIGVSLINFCACGLVVRSLRKLKHSRNQLEQALAEAHQLRGLAQQAMTKYAGPY